MLDVFFKGLRKAEKFLLVLLMVALIFVCAAQVFFRLVMNAPLAWTEEVARYTFVWMTFIGAAAVMGNWGHFQVDFLLAYLPSWLVKAFRYFSYACILCFVYFMTVSGWTLLENVFVQRSAALLVSMAYPYAALPLSGLLMAVHIFEHILNDFRRKSPDGAEAKA